MPKIVSRGGYQWEQAQDGTFSLVTKHSKLNGRFDEMQDGTCLLLDEDEFVVREFSSYAAMVKWAFEHNVPLFSPLEPRAAEPA